MSILGHLNLGSSYDDVAEAIITEAARRGYSRDEAIGVVADGIQESGLNPRAHNPAGPWDGIYQQDGSYPGRFDANTQISGFLDRLDLKRTSPGHGDIWLNIFWLQQAPGRTTAQLAYDLGRKAYLTEIKSRTSEATRLVNLYWPNGGVPPVTNQPDYGITKVMHGFNPNTADDATGNSNGPRAQTLYVVLHTQEGDGTAVSLANFLNSSTDKSYNLTVDAVDTVEVVPVIEGPWAAVDANDIGVHVCFAGSKVAWSRDDWLAHNAMLRRGAKAVAAACTQFDLPVVKVQSSNGWPTTPKGIAGHGDFGARGGGHTDPYPNFPFPEFLAMVNGAPAQPPAQPAPAPAPAVKPWPQSATDRELLEYIAAQLGPGDPGWTAKGMTLRDKVWTLNDTKDAS